MNTLAAEWIYTPTGFQAGMALEVTEEGMILACRKMLPDEKPVIYPGYLVPGFVNTHCHLELSHLWNKIPANVGMTGFIRSIFMLRNEKSLATQIQAATAAIQQASDTGTVAIGDICNGTASLEAKRAFPNMYFHNFVEILGLNPQSAVAIIEKAVLLAQEYMPLNAATLTPHAPYSCSEVLLEEIYKLSPSLLSIHLLESEAERQLFERSQGPLVDMYRDLSLPYTAFHASSPIEHIQKGLKKDQKVIWVHVTEIRIGEINRLFASFPESYICICPGANLFLHGKMPPISDLLYYKDKICIGTDSLAGNIDLDMWREMRLLLNDDISGLPFHTVCKWATSNGAAALGIADRYGDFMVGARPGINLLQRDGTCTKLF